MRVHRALSLFAVATVLGPLALPGAVSASARASGDRAVAQADGLFGPYAATRVGRSWPEAVTTGDVTGDGRPDVLLSTLSYDDPELDYKLLVYAQRGDGTLAPPVLYATELGWQDDDGAGLALLDVDGDDRLDVALGTDRGVQIFRQTAGGVLTDAGLVAGTAHTRWVAALDMDRDADTDLVASGYEGSTLLTQDGGWFTASAVTTKPTRDVAAGDLDGDGLGDVVSVYGRELTVHHRAGGGWREVRHPMAYVESNAPDGLEVADLSGDGRADLAVALGGNLPDGRLNVFTQTPAGELAAPVTYLTPDMPGALTAADVNGDGRTDLVNIHNGWLRLAALIQAPDGTLGSRVFARLPYATWYNRQGLALGDVNSDGRPDAVIADYNSGLVVVPNTGGPVPAVDAHVWVTATTPADGATGVPTTAQPRIVVRHRLDPESINYNTVFMIRADGRSAYGDLAYDAASGTITLTPDPPLRPGETYQLVVGRLKTPDGTVSEVPAVFHFTTA
jgi:hypothetical protein